MQNDCGPLECFINHSFDVFVSASDGVETTVVGVSVNVVNVNEHAPIFSPSATYSGNVAEDSSPDDLILTVLANDADRAGKHGIHRGSANYLTLVCTWCWIVG